MVLDTFCEALDALVATDPADCSDGESIVALHRAIACLEAFTTQATGAFDTWGEWANDEALSPAAWVAKRCHVAKAEARARVGLARKLCHLKKATEAWAAGELSAAHLRALGALRNDATAEALERDEALLVEMAKDLSFEEFSRSLAYWKQLADPDGCEDRAERQRCARDVTLAETFQGMFLGKITLDPISGVIVSDELRRLEKRFYEADWAEAKERLGREPLTTELARTPSQRRADALVEMATRSKAAPEGASAPGPLFTVMVDFDTVVGRLCQLARGTVVTPGSLVAYLDRAIIERAVLTPSGRVEISEKSRLFTGATRRAIEVRDRCCTHPYCDQPAERCEVDHITPFAKGGPTTQANGRMLCGPHNRMRNQRPPPDG